MSGKKEERIALLEEQVDALVEIVDKLAFHIGGKIKDAYCERYDLLTRNIEGSKKGPTL